VTLQAKKGKIIISKPSNPRENWGKNIKAMVEKYGDPSEEFTDLNDALADDGLGSLAWDGITYEEWLKTNGRLS
jgi:hypothetical protein